MSLLPHHQTVSDVMTAHVHVAGPQTPFNMLVRLVGENRVSAIPIVDKHGVPLGIVSETDLLLRDRRRDQGAGVQGLLARDLMTSPPITVPSTSGLNGAARLMQERNVRRLVVVDERGKISGIVSRSDLLHALLRGDEERTARAI
jgi:CBS domain-containing protein